MMSRLRMLAARFRGLFTGSRHDAELTEELDFHVGMETDRLISQGLSPDAARQLALRRFGSVEVTKDAYRDQRGLPWLDQLASDVGYGLRLLRRAPGFTTVAVLTLAFGIGANTAVFSLIDAVLLQPLPYREPDRLALVWLHFDSTDQTKYPASPPELGDLIDRTTLFEDIGGTWSSTGALTGAGEPEQVRMGFVTWNFLSILGVAPALGRHFLPEEQGRGANNTIILADGLWRRRYAADPAIVGRQIQFEGNAVTVIGVMPPGFEILFPSDSAVPRDIQAWVPFGWQPSQPPRTLAHVRVLARMRPGVTPTQVASELDTIAAQLKTEYARYNELGLGFDVFPLQQEVVKDVRPALLALFAGVVIVLLIACVNVASLQLGRLAGRSRELSLRSALGAGRRRIAQQLLVESLLLSCLGGLAGLLVGRLALASVLTLRPDELERLDTVGLSPVVFVFTFVVSLAAGLAFGLAPTIRATGAPLVAALKEGGGRSGSTPLTDRFRWLLVLGEVALGVILLVGAGLMVRSLTELLRLEPGFRAAGVLTFQVSLPGARYPGDAPRAIFARDLEARLRELPGVRAVGGVSHLPLDDYPNWFGFYYADGASDAEKIANMADQRTATPGYFESLGAELVAGRLFDEHDDEETRRVVIVDRILAERLWPGENPIGKGLHFEGWENGPFVLRRAEVVGVVKHIRHHSLTTELRPQIYVPYPQSARPVMTYAVRTDGSPQALVGPVRQALARLDRDLPFSKVRTLQEYVDRASAGARFTALLASLFAALALLLASIGLYGVVSFGVRQRTREIGVRLTLGATPTAIRRAVVGEGLTAAGAGLGLGLLGALAVGGLLERLLFGVSSKDPLTYAVVAGVLLAVALVAAYLPARRATRVDPMLALRTD